jgi:hypothetical protein
VEVQVQVLQDMHHALPQQRIKVQEQLVKEMLVETVL